MENEIIQDIYNATVIKLAALCDSGSYENTMEKDAGVSHSIRKFLSLLKHAPDMNRKSIKKVKGVKEIGEKMRRHSMKSLANSQMPATGEGNAIIDALRQNRIGSEQLGARYGVTPDYLGYLSMSNGRVKDFLKNIQGHKDFHKDLLNQRLDNIWQNGRSVGSW